MTNIDEALDLEAMRALGKPYSECSLAEKDAVDFGLTATRVIDTMRASGATTLGELMAARRKGTDK